LFILSNHQRWYLPVTMTLKTESLKWILFTAYKIEKGLLHYVILQQIET
jgi:hypothetical protein